MYDRSSFCLVFLVYEEKKGGKMRRLRQRISLLVVLCLLSGTTVYANETEATEEHVLYEKMLEAYSNGEAMKEWVVEARQQIAEELGLSEQLDERSFLSINYIIDNQLDLSDERLNLLVEMGTKEDEEIVWTKGLIQAMSINASEGSVKVIQMPRLSGAKYGYFSVESSGQNYADSYGYCAQNSMHYWNNGGAKYGAIREWDTAVGRKIIYYAPGGPGYAAHAFKGNIPTDMDYATCATSRWNTGDSHNNAMADEYINYVNNLPDPLIYGYRGYIADITGYYEGKLCQDVAFLSLGDVVADLTISKRSVSDMSGIDGYKYLSGAAFELYAWTGSAFSTYVTTSVDNGDGTYTFKNVRRNLSADATFLVKEVRAKEGYSTEYYKFSAKDIRDFNVYGGRQFLLDGAGNWSCFSLQDFQYPHWGFEILDYPEQVTVTITKEDSCTGEKLVGAGFELWAYQNRNGSYERNHKVGEFTDNQDGTYSISFAFDIATFVDGYYWYDFIETKAPEGYEKDSDVAKGYKICFNANGKGTREFTVKNEPISYDLVVLKQNNFGKALEGAEFALYRDEECTDIVQTGISDENGNIKFTNLFSKTKYYLKEIKAPLGYRLPTDENGNPVVTEIEASVNSTTEEITLYVDGKQYELEEGNGFWLSGTMEMPEITMLAINEVGYLLPQTGSYGALVFTITGMLLLVIYSKNQFKRKEN